MNCGGAPMSSWSPLKIVTTSPVPGVTGAKPSAFCIRRV